MASMAAIMAPLVVSVHSVVGLDFAGAATPGWHSTEYPADLRLRRAVVRAVHGDAAVAWHSADHSALTR